MRQQVSADPLVGAHGSDPGVIEVKVNTLKIAAVLIGALWLTPSLADSTQARCEIYPKGSDRMDKMVPCTFSQRRGYITITRDDGVTHDLSLVGDTPGNFEDQNGRRAISLRKE